MSFGKPDDITRRLTDATRLECSICWHVYDPALGDPDQGVPPGTPFRSLPENWSCPQCDSSKTGFLILDDDQKAFREGDA